MDMSPIFPAVRQAVELIRRVRAQLPAYNHKGSNDPVTIADYASQALLLRAFSRVFPNDAIMAEEYSEQFLSLVAPDLRSAVVSLLADILNEPVTEADVLRWLDHGRSLTGERLWTVDPIDGTRGYVAGRRYSVAISLLVNYQVTAGLLACPEYPNTTGEGLLLYTTADGAYAESLTSGIRRRIHVSEESDPRHMHIVESRDSVDIDSALVRPVLDAAGVTIPPVDFVDGQDKYAMVAAGDVEAYIRPIRPIERPQSIWDHAPGVALVQAAGGLVTDLEGNPLDFSRGRTLPTIGVIAAGKPAHEQLMQAVRSQLDLSR
jgi:3'(2'), 5'-bisphosphate nucleotidase